MVVLIVILVFHALVILRAKTAVHDQFPYLSVFLISVGLVAGVAWMMINMKVPG